MNGIGEPMDLFSIILISLGLAMDAFAVSVSCGICVIKHRYLNALKIAGYFGFFQWMMLTLGWLAGLTFRNLIEPFDNWVAFILLLLIGAKMWKESMNKESKQMDLTSSKLMLTLAIATSIDALAAGISISTLGYPILTPALFVGSIAFSMSFIGVLLGCWLTQFERFSKYLDRLGAIILIGMSLKILIQNL